MSITIANDPTIAIADALATALPALDWGEELLEFRQVSVPQLDREDLDEQSAHILIASAETESQRVARGSTADEIRITFAVRAACRADDLARYRYLHALAYEVGRQILQGRTYADATAVRIETEALIDVDRLRTSSEFLTVRSAIFDYRSGDLDR